MDSVLPSGAWSAWPFEAVSGATEVVPSAEALETVDDEVEQAGAAAQVVLEEAQEEAAAREAEQDTRAEEEGEAA